MSTPAVDETNPLFAQPRVREQERPWRPPLRMYELPPSRPVRINQRERREAIRFWKQAGVIDNRGQVRRAVALGRGGALPLVY